MTSSSNQGAGGSKNLASVLSGNNQVVSGQAGFHISRSSTPTNQRKSPLHEPKQQERRSNAVGQPREQREQRDPQRVPQQFNRGGQGARREFQQLPQQPQQIQPRGPPRGQHYAPQGGQRQQNAPQGFSRGGGNQSQGYGGRGGMQEQRQGEQRQGYVQNFGQRSQNAGRPLNTNNRPPHQWNTRPGAPFNRPPRTDLSKLDDYDFEKANQEFTELESKFAELGTDDVKPVEEPEQLLQQDVPKGDDLNDDNDHYDKKKSFFDTISCEAIEREKG